VTQSNNYSEFYTRKRPDIFTPLVSFWHKRMLTIAARFIPNFKQKTLLEIGPGCAFLAKRCVEDNMTYRAIEMNEQQAAFLQNEGYHVIPATVPPIPAGEPVQVIWLSHMLEHVASHSEAKALLLACYDRIDADGYVVIIGPDVYHWKADFWGCDWSHGYPTSVFRVEQLLNETGFSLHQSMHHTATITNSFFAWLISVLFRFAPMDTLDFMFYKKFKWRPCQAFMHKFGLRQIYVIGKK